MVRARCRNLEVFLRISEEAAVVAKSRTKWPNMTIPSQN
jgi:hypothetical protein